MYQNRKALLEKIGDDFNAEPLLFVTSDRGGMEIQIAGDVFDHVVNHLDAIGVTERIVLIIYSRGGDTLAAWSIINLIRQYCDNLIALLPSRAHSAAALMSLGANEIVMTKQATLGPIDPSVNGPLNPQIPGRAPNEKAPVSVEGINGFLELAHEQKIENSEEMLQILLSLSQQVHPLVLGDVFRAKSQIRMLAKRLVSNQVQDEKQSEKILDFMCSESGSHDYTINRREAHEDLGLNITKPTQEQYETIKSLYDDLSGELQLPNQFNLKSFMGGDTVKDYIFRRGLIESVAFGSHAFVSEGQFVNRQQPGQPDIFTDQISSFDGWRHEHE